MPLVTPAPVEKQIAQSVQTDETVIESVTTDKLWTREQGTLFEQRIERFWLLNGQVVNAKVVTIRPDIIAAKMARPDVQAAYALLRDINYEMLKEMNEAPAEAQLVDTPPAPPTE